MPCVDLPPWTLLQPTRVPSAAALLSPVGTKYQEEARQAEGRRAGTLERRPALPRRSPEPGGLDAVPDGPGQAHNVHRLGA